MLCSGFTLGYLVFKQDPPRLLNARVAVLAGNEAEGQHNLGCGMQQHFYSNLSPRSN